ncbi:MAG: phosphotransferase [Pseudomonadales bacterium]
MDHRQTALSEWVVDQLQQLNLYQDGHDESLVAVSGDASFRRYFRTAALSSGQTLIAVDAPADKEDSRPFVAIAQAWLEQGVHVPEVRAADFDLGFMLLSDLGDDLFLPQLETHADSLYQAALGELVTIQRSAAPHDYALPNYAADKLRQEMQLCPDWFFKQLLGLELSAEDKQRLDNVVDKLVASALEQPQVCVHRDYHSRNLMTLADGHVGVLDFQDAVVGPITYDLVSLLRDCYISWSDEHEEKWIGDYLQLSLQYGLWPQVDMPEYAVFKRWFDWMGLQRHLKCVGIFSRLYLRDGKAGYLQDIPRTFAYLKKVCEQYTEFAEFNGWLDEVVVPAMQNCEYLTINKETA